MDALSEPQDTIVAIATPPGRGGIGMVRLAGPDAVALATPLLRLREPLAPTRARFTEIIYTATGEVLDQAVVTFFAAPHSYTGDDIVEIAAHGAPVLLDHLLRACCAAGARLARPGEFTERAFLAGRLDLTQAEAIADLIAASTLEQARAAARQLGGALSGQVAPAKQALVELIAELEAGIDFADSEDDISTLPAPEIARRLTAVETPLAALARTFTFGRLLRDGFQLALAGRPNAGKSSLFNRLLERDRAIVTAAPGTTRDPIAERLSLDGIPVELIDTAGLRSPASALDEAERLGILKSREAVADAALILLVLDSSQPLHPEDEAILHGATGRPLVVALNKSDLRGTVAEQTLAALDLTPAPFAVRTSALTGEGLPALRSAILAALQSGAAADGGALVTNLRQHQALTAAVEGLTQAHAATTSKLPHEMLLLDLYSALHALDELTGATTTDDLLQLIFSRFCIGK